MNIEVKIQKLEGGKKYMGTYTISFSSAPAD
jgi:hypothetical protein